MGSAARTCPFVFVLFVFFSPYAHAGFGPLLDIARAQDDAQRSYKEETRIFERVKAAVDRGEIKKGQTKTEVNKRYGEPVVNTAESGTGRDKWIYKPAKSSFFAGIRIYLYFDRDNKLDEIKIVE